MDSFLSSDFVVYNDGNVDGPGGSMFVPFHVIGYSVSLVTDLACGTSSSAGWTNIVPTTTFASR